MTTTRSRTDSTRVAISSAPRPSPAKPNAYSTKMRSLTVTWPESTTRTGHDASEAAMQAL